MWQIERQVIERGRVLRHDKTRYVWMYMYVLKRKSEVFNVFHQWKAEVEKSLGYSVKVLRSDNGGEYTSSEFDEFLKQEGIKHELTIPKSPEQNGVAEWMNRTLVEKVRSILADSHLPKSFWAEALPLPPTCKIEALLRSSME